jgi:hypothetical protein
VHGVADGAVGITAAYDSVTGSLSVTVTGISTIALTPASVTLEVGDHRVFTAQATYSDSTTADVTALATWTMDVTTVATVAGSTASAVGGGAAVLTASYQGVSGTADISVLVPWAHKITIDGVNDFAAATEAFATTSGGYTAYVTWDADNVYVGLNGGDVSSGDGNKVVQIYVGSEAADGITDGVAMTPQGCPSPVQQPALAFPALYYVGWRADNSATWASTSASGSWADAGWSWAGRIWQSGNYVEFSLSRANLGSHTHLRLAMSMINAGNCSSGGQWTYAGLPSTSFADGVDPDYAKFFDFDLNSDKAPNAYVASP